MRVITKLLIISILMLALISNSYAKKVTKKQKKEAQKVYKEVEKRAKKKWIRFPAKNSTVAAAGKFYAVDGDLKKLIVTGKRKSTFEGEKIEITKTLSGLNFKNIGSSKRYKKPKSFIPKSKKSKRKGKWKFDRFMDTPYPKHSGTSGGDLAVGDVTGDGFADIIISGFKNPRSKTIIYKYTKTGYTIIKDHGLPDLHAGCRVELGDVNKDKKLDVVMFGKKEADQKTSILNVYTNKGNGTFQLFDILGDDIPYEDFEDEGVPAAWAGTDKAIQGLYDFNGWSQGGLELKDLDNDGDLDILFMGNKGFEAGIVLGDMKGFRDWETSGVFINSGTGKFRYFGTDKKNPNYCAAGFSKACRAATAIADFNGDGILDLALTGTANRGPKANPGLPETQRNGKSIGEIYLGKGDGSFKELKQKNIPNLIDGSITPIDINKDGKIDLIFTGNTGHPKDPHGGRVFKIYHGLGNGKFKLDKKQKYGKIGMVPVMSGNIAVGDLDGDGDLDLVSAGNENTRTLRIYENKKGKFVNKALSKMRDGIGTTSGGRSTSDSVTECDVAVHDIDNDGDLDIIVNGRGGSNQLLVFVNKLK